VLTLSAIALTPARPPIATERLRACTKRNRLRVWFGILHVPSRTRKLRQPASARSAFVACARGGSPLAILTEGGELYVSISDQMPDVDQRQKLIPLLGKCVRASGVVNEGQGTRTIMINKIEELKDVHLTIEDQ